MWECSSYPWAKWSSASKFHHIWSCTTRESRHSIKKTTDRVLLVTGQLTWTYFTSESGDLSTYFNYYDFDCCEPETKHNSQNTHTKQMNIIVSYGILPKFSWKKQLNILFPFLWQHKPIPSISNDFDYMHLNKCIANCFWRGINQLI